MGWIHAKAVPIARRASPSAPKPTLAPWRSTSPALGGAAGTGCPLVTTVCPSDVTAALYVSASRSLHRCAGHRSRRIADVAVVVTSFEQDGTAGKLSHHEERDATSE